MSLWRRVKKQRVTRELRVPKVDAKKLEELKVSRLKHLSQDDRAMVQSLKNELTASGFLDREELIELKPIDDDIDNLFQLAGEQGTTTTSQLPSYDSELDDEISAGEGGQNLLLDDLDDYDEEAFDVYKTLKTFDRVSVSKTEDDSVEVRLPDGTIIQGHIPEV
jgi:hypothetical protein